MRSWFGRERVSRTVTLRWATSARRRPVTSSTGASGRSSRRWPVAERPILFSAPMVRAILAGTKTQTRRIVTNKHALRLLDDAGFTPAFVALPENGLSPYGFALGDLWVRE